MRRPAAHDRMRYQTLAYAAACASVVLAVGSLAPAGAPRSLAWLLGAVIAAALAAPYLRRATSASAVGLTAGAATVSLVCVLSLSGASISAGLAASRAGDVGSAWAWLFSLSMWCLAVGLHASGRLMIGDGIRCGMLDGGGERRAGLLTWLASGGFFIVGAVPVGAGRAFDVVHDQAAILAMGAFWFGMLATMQAHRIPHALRRFSGASAVLVPLCWAPIEAKMLGLIAAAPVRTLHMQTLIFAMSVAWLVWLARDLAHEAQTSPVGARVPGHGRARTHLAGR